MAYTGSYLSVERIALGVGAFELVFLIVAWQANPDFRTVASEAIDIPWRDTGYLYLVAANIGAVIMPWMVFYQQGAVIEKKLTIADLPAARWDTAIGAVVTQLIMVGVLIAAAATLGMSGQHGTLETVQQIAQALTPFLGETAGLVLFARAFAARSAVVLRHLHGSTRRGRGAGRLRSESGGTLRRRAGDERAPAPDRARVPLSARASSATAVSAARGLRVGRGAHGYRDSRLRRLRRFDRTGRIVVGGLAPAPLRSCQ
jgi:hypothetical protein